MKRKTWGIVLLFLVVVLIGMVSFIQIQMSTVKVVLVEDLTVAFLEQKHASDFIKETNGTLLDDFVIDTSNVGEQEVKVQFRNEYDRKVHYTFPINVVDTTAPVIWLGNTYRVKQGSQINLEKQIMCGDNYDNTPKCWIEGEYDLTTIGEYSLVLKAVDHSGNQAEQPFTLVVYEPSSATKPVVTTTEFASIVEKHKTETTEIGLDVSSWQGEIDFEKIKAAGVEFMMLRVGGTRGTNGEYFLDRQFIRNITNANQYGIKVGIYFYSYANSLEAAQQDANWVLEQIKDYQIDLPIAFDWEEWGNYNEYHLSFFGLTSMAEKFLETIEKAGYEGMLYSSKAYLERIWFPTKYDIWLAHYTTDTNYQGSYQMWQLCNDGSIDGIKGAVDINIRYLNQK